MQLRIRHLEEELAARDAKINQLERRADDIAAQADCWFWETDSQHIYRYISDNLEQVAPAFRREDFVGHNRLNIIANSQSEQKSHHIDGLLYHRPFRNFRYSIKGASGELRHIVSTGWPVFSADGNFDGYRGSSRDETVEINELNANQEREMSYLATIQRNALQFQAVIDNLNQSIMWFDEDGRLRRKNPRMATTHNLAPDAVEHIASLKDYARVLARRGDLGPGNLDELAKQHVEFILGELRERETARIHLQEADIYLRARFANLPGGGFVISHTDISEEVNNAVALGDALTLVEDANRALEDRVEERTRELRELQGKLIAEERNATMTKLIAKISHELRNPLNGLNASLYIIRSKAGDDPKLTKAFDRSERTIKRCVNILGDLYDYTMTQDVNPRAVEIGTWCEEQLKQLRMPDDVRLEFENQAAGVISQIDEQVLIKAIFKILHNAIRALTDEDLPRNDKRIRFVVRTNGDRVEIDVSDNGIGMPADVAHKAIEPLFSTRGFGVGLGVPFAEQSFRQHGGGLRLESNPGEGTTVTMWLPGKPAEPAQQVA
jgi:signal transduction histidine kinase